MSIDINEFLDRKVDDTVEGQPAETEELDVQKAVVESLAADKAEQDERITSLQRENDELKSRISALNDQIEKMRVSLEKVGDILATNSEGEMSNKIALLDRDPELEDKYSGETRDHVIEVIKEAYEAAEKDGRLRRAKILESVLLANVTSGNLAKRREELNKLFNENANVINGTVMSALKELSIPFKNGEEYLLPSEIIKRNY